MPFEMLCECVRQLYQPSLCLNNENVTASRTIVTTDERSCGLSLTCLTAEIIVVTGLLSLNARLSKCAPISLC